MRTRAGTRTLAFTASAILAVGLGLTVATPAHALGNGLALTPPMGFNSWNAVGCDVSERLIEQVADYFVSSGLKEDGYEYVNIDDCWLSPSRDADGRLVPDPVKFPDGIKGTADYVHSRGLKLGIYEDAGTATCQGYPGSLGHETVDAQTLADWGVDYLKYDNCNNDGLTSRDQFIARYTAMGDALRATGRHILYSICQWGGQDAWTWAGDIGNMWRTAGDLKDNWGRLKEVIAANAPLAAYAHPGAWNDPDMLEVGNGGMTDAEYRTHFSLWAEMAAPLLISTDLRTASAATLRILGNRDVIAVDQDPLGAQGSVIKQGVGTMVFNKPLANGDRAVALYNSSDVSATITTTAAAAGLPASYAYALKDLWNGGTAETAGTISAEVPAHGAVLYRVSTTQAWPLDPPAATLSLAAPSTYDYAAADVALAPGASAHLDSALTDNARAAIRGVRVTVSGPPGWHTQPPGPQATPTLAPGGTLKTDWTLSAPASATPGLYQATVTATYTYLGQRTSTIRSVAVIRVVPPPPGGNTPLADVAWVTAATGDGTVQKGLSSAGNPIAIRGTTYTTGLGVRSTSDIVYYLGGACSSLTTEVGIDDEVAGKGLVIFQMYGDSAIVADSGPVKGTSPVVTLQANLTGVTWLRLHVDPDGTNSGANVSDHADWANPQLTCAS